MRQPSSVVPLLLALVVASTTAAQPGPTTEVPGVRHIELEEEGANSELEVAISPGVTTAFRFHGATLDREGVTPNGDERL